MSNTANDIAACFHLAWEEWSYGAEWAADLEYDSRLTDHQREYLTSKIRQVCRVRSVREIAAFLKVSLEEADAKLTEAGCDPFRI